MLALLLAPALALERLRVADQGQGQGRGARPVRTVTATKGGNGETVVLTGQISAENEASLSFRIGGRID